MMEEEEAAMVVVQMEEAVLLQMDGHHLAVLVVLTADHQMEDHQVAEAVLQEQEAPGHLHPAREEAAVADLKAHLLKEEVAHLAADVVVKKAVLLINNFTVFCQLKNRAAALFFLFINFLKDILWQQKLQAVHKAKQMEKPQK